MSEWLKALLGVEDADIPPDASASFEFANAPTGSAGLIFLLILLALAAGVFWVYRREGNAPPRAKLVLGLLRMLVFLCVLLVALEPVLSIDQVEEVDKATVLLLDDSLSMTTRDRYTDPVARARLLSALQMEPAQRQRVELVNAALRATDLPAKLALQNEVFVFRFSDVAQPHASLSRGDASPVGALDPEADEETRRRSARGTNLAGAIRQAVDQVGSDRIAALIVVTDGRATLGPPAEDVALFLKNKDLKLHTVVVGEEDPPRNLRAVALAGPDRIYRNDPIALDARVSGRGYGGATVLFERRYKEAGKAWERIGMESVIFPADGQPMPLKFHDRPPRVGTVEFRIRIEEEPDEATHRDNEKTFVARVVDEKAKVLLVSGGPAYEYYGIKNTLLRDTTIQVACFLQSADPLFPQDGNEISLRQLPEDEKGLLYFDVVILVDPDGEHFPTDWPALLRGFVNGHGGGLCFVAGNKYTLRLLRTAKGENDLTGLLPVVLDLDRADQPGIGIGYGAFFTSAWRLEPEPAAFTHPATRFHSDPKQARALVWDLLPPFYWFFPVLKAKPGAVVLARHEDVRERVEPYGQRPILATHRYGAGNVMFLAADETHRWRSRAEHIFDRFWVQSVRFLLEGRHAGARRRFRIYCDREVVDLGDAVRITVEAFTEKYKPLQAEFVDVRITGGDEFEQDLRLLPVPEQEGQFAGSFAAPDLGDYAIRGGDGGEGPPGATFMVIQPDREMGDVRADSALLRRLAARTRGLALGLADLERLTEPALIPPASERVVIQGQPVPLWDTWTTIILVLILLCLEWILRKRFRMV